MKWHFGKRLRTCLIFEESGHLAGFWQPRCVATYAKLVKKRWGSKSIALLNQRPRAQRKDLQNLPRRRFSNGLNQGVRNG